MESPRVKAGDPSDDLILPDFDLFAADDPDLHNPDYIRPAIGECLMYRSPPRLLDNPMLHDARIHEAQQTLAQAAGDWGQRLNRERDSNRVKIERLLERHAAELRAFETDHNLANFSSTVPQFIEAVLNVDDPSLYRVRNPSFGAGTSLLLSRPFQKVRADVVHQRRKMINRHKLEIMILNTECSGNLRALEKMRDVELAQKRATLQSLRGEFDPEFRDEPIGSETPQPAGRSRVIRLSLRTLQQSR
jgi:hypothetical protein